MRAVVAHDVRCTRRNDDGLPGQIRRRRALIGGLQRHGAAGDDRVLDARVGVPTAARRRVQQQLLDVEGGRAGGLDQYRLRGGAGGQLGTFDVALGGRGVRSRGADEPRPRPSRGSSCR